MRRTTPSDTGEIVQRTRVEDGRPRRVAGRTARRHRAASPIAPSRVVVWSTAPEPDTGRRRRDSILVARDPADVPAKSIYPPPKRVLASSEGGGRAVLRVAALSSRRAHPLVAVTPVGNGTLIPDLYLWNTQTHDVHRVTRHAGLRDADPAPAGSWAVATQCRHGWCDLVRVSLEDGRTTMLAAGSPDTSYSRPRLSPDGSRVAVGRHVRGGWRVVVIDLDAGARPRGEQSVEPANTGNETNEYDPTWLSASSIAFTSDASGAPAIETANLSTGARRRLTALSGAAVAPEADRRDTTVWFLSLYSRGYDLRRTRATAPAAVATVTDWRRLLPSRYARRVKLPLRPDRSHAPRPFRLSPRFLRWLPEVHADPDGASAGLALVSSDVIGRSELLLDFAAGQAAAWRGGRVSAVWRGTRPAIRVALFDAQQDLSESASHREPTFPLDTRLQGGELALDNTWAFDTRTFRYRLGGSVARRDERARGDRRHARRRHARAGLSRRRTVAVASRRQ